ncbi:unnamed protein product [Onchocerca flexuosa]|nr:unnamed protein product [Onchocerca flexuosa]
MTNTFTSMQSCGNLNRNLNLNHTLSKSNSISEMAAGDEKLPNKLKSNIDEKSILPEEKSWISGLYDSNCDDGSLQILDKHKNCNKKTVRKKMIEEYKLSESVAAMIRKYEEQSHVESEQNIHNF